MAEETKAAMSLSRGDRIVVEAEGMPDFEATVTAHLGWGLVHGVLNLGIRKDDGTEMTYGIGAKSPVKVVNCRG